MSDLSVTEFLDLAEVQCHRDRAHGLNRRGTRGQGSVLGCSAEDAQIDFCSRVDELQADFDVAKLLVSGIESNC